MSKRSRAFICIALAATMATSLVGCGSGNTPDIAPHLISSPDASPVRPIDSFETVEMKKPSGGVMSDDYRACVGELYSVVVYDRKKPVFSENDPVAEIYNAAVEVLNTYVLNSWHSAENGEYNIVHTIHDYLVTSVDYDFDLFNAHTSGAINAQDSPSFDIDGVFINKLAVCDGLSRAFNFLCAIEDIESVRVTGTFMSMPHAWNKVKLDGKWYNLDVTADAVHYTVGGKRTKQLSHGYFLLSDNTYMNFRAGTPPKRHVFEGDWNAYADYDYHTGKAVSVGGRTYPSVVKSAAELNSIFTAIGNSKKDVGKIELKLAFPDKINVNDADMYEAEIAAAYACIKNPDFNVTESQKPYFQAPNGVYLFLINR